MAATPTRAHAATPEARAALPLGVDSWGPMGVFGSTILFGRAISTNGGASWIDAGFPKYPGLQVGDDDGMVETNETGTLVAVYTASTNSLTSYALTNTPTTINRTWSIYTGTNGYDAKRYVTGGIPVSMAFPAGMPFARPNLGPSDAVLWSYNPMFALAASPTATPGAAVTIPGMRDWRLTKTQFLYLVATASDIQFCSRSLADFEATPTCISTGVSPDSTYPSIYPFGASAVIQMHNYLTSISTGFYWNGSALAPIQIPAGFQLDQPSTHGTTPSVLLRDANTLPTVNKVNADGSLSAGFALPALTTATVKRLALSPDHAVGSDDRDGSTMTPVWSRSISGSAFGSESTLPRRASGVAASAGRTVISGSDGLSIYDRGQLNYTFSDARFEKISGPYVFRDGAVVGVDGTPQSGTSTGGYGMLFGSRFATYVRDNLTQAHVLLHDLTGRVADSSVALASGSADCYAPQMWGDLVASNCNHTERAVDVYSLTSGALITSITGSDLVELGDGYVVTRDALTGAPSMHNLATGTTTPLVDCAPYAPVATDGVGHIACTSDTELIWRDFSSLSTSPPRLLGVLASGSVDFTTTSSWTPQIDLTKALAAGTLVVRNSSGTIVRTLATPASTDGSIRAVSWDGKNDSGAPVPTGNYTYTLTATGKDGSGVATSIDGAAPATGTVTVTANVVNTAQYDPFVKAAYQDFLRRQPTTTELTAKSTALANGTLTKNAFLTTMANSDEWLSTIVTKMYQDTLGRDPDAAGLTFWTGLIRNKTFSVAEVASRLYSSDEYYLYHAGGTPTTWVTALYQALLSRAPDAAGLQHWVNLTNTPSYGRNRVALDFYQSTESRLKRVNALYQALLGRGPDPTGWPYWAAQVYTTGDIVLATNLANSEEYWLRAKARY